MKILNNIPYNFEELAESDLVGDSESLTEEDLEQFDRQLKHHGLEIVRFENGAAINWIIRSRENT